MPTQKYYFTKIPLQLRKEEEREKEKKNNDDDDDDDNNNKLTNKQTNKQTDNNTFSYSPLIPKKKVAYSCFSIMMWHVGVTETTASTCQWLRGPSGPCKTTRPPA